jgi:hypothetical protein
VGSLAHERPLPVERPVGWLRLAVAALLGAFVSEFVLALLRGGLGLVGVQTVSFTTVWRPGGVLGWPYARSGAWSVFADLVVIGVECLVVAVAVTTAVGILADREASFAVIAPAVAVTGFAVPGPYGNHVDGTVALLVVVLASRYAVGQRVSIPLGRSARRLVLAFVTAVSLAAVGVAVAYPLTHPLRFQGRWFGGPRRVYTFTIRNDGRAHVTLVRLTAAGAERSGIGFLPSPPSPPLRPVRGARLGRHAETTLSLALASRCPPKTVTMTYRIFGTVRSQTIPLEPPAGCRR